MILSLRQQHRRLFAFLGVALPIVFVVGVAARRLVPTVGALPLALANAVEKFAATAWQRSDLFTKFPIQVRLLREPSGSGRFAVSFSAAKDFVKPDLLVYWVAGHPALTDRIPENALLLGAFSSGALALPPEAGNADGALILFSLADQEIVDVSQPTRFNDSTK